MQNSQDTLLVMTESCKGLWYLLTLPTYILNIIKIICITVVLAGNIHKSINEEGVYLKMILFTLKFGQRMHLHTSSSVIRSNTENKGYTVNKVIISKPQPWSIY